jgi:hypothetical protein
LALLIRAPAEAGEKVTDDLFPDPPPHGLLDEAGTALIQFLIMPMSVAMVKAKRLDGTTVQVVNKPGGGTVVGLTAVANSKPDDYTLGMADFPTTNSTYQFHSTGPALPPKAPRTTDRPSTTSTRPLP